MPMLILWILLLGLFWGNATPLSGHPSPALSASNPISPEDWQSFSNTLQRRTHHFQGIVGYIVKDLQTGRVVESHAETPFRSASLIKLPVLVAAYQAVQDGRISLSTSFILNREDKRGGSGVLKYAFPGTVLTLRELLEYMIIDSDNTAAQIVTRRLGFGYLQDTFQKLGLRDTRIHSRGFLLTPRAITDDNMTSPRDMAYLLEKIYRRQLVSTPASEDMLLILKHQKLRDRLPRYLPTGWEIAHKTGLLRRACHDVGIVFSPHGDYLVCVLTSRDGETYRVSKRFISTMGRITFDYYEGGFHRPIVQTRHLARLPNPAG